MEKIKTPYGEIELNYDRIEVPISDSPFGFKRTVTWDEIPYLSDTGRYAEIVWIVKTKDDEGNLITHPDIRSERRVSTIISSENSVTLQGITITRESYPNDELGEQEWMNAKKKGIDEYSYYRALITVIPLPQVLTMAIKLLDTYKTFDK